MRVSVNGRVGSSVRRKEHRASEERRLHEPHDLAMRARVPTRCRADERVQRRPGRGEDAIMKTKSSGPIGNASPSGTYAMRTYTRHAERQGGRDESPKTRSRISNERHERVTPPGDPPTWRWAVQRAPEEPVGRNGRATGDTRHRWRTIVSARNSGSTEPGPLSPHSRRRGRVRREARRSPPAAIPIARRDESPR